MPEKLRTYTVYFRTGAVVHVKAVRIEKGNIFGNSSLVLIKEDGSPETTAYLPFSDVLYVVPADLEPSAFVA